MAGAAPAMGAHAPLTLVIALAAAISLVATPAEPAFAGLMPQLATTPVELTAANVASSAIQSVGFFAGPALGGALLAASGPAAATTVTAGLVLASAALTARIPPMPVEREGVRLSEVAAEVSEGIGAIRSDRRLPPLIGLLAATTLVDGALEVLVVVVAIRLTGLGNAGVGYLNAGFGIGALVGAALSTLLVGTRRLSVPFVVGILLWGAPIALLAIPAPAAVAVALLGIVGSARRSSTSPGRRSSSAPCRSASSRGCSASCSRCGWPRSASAPRLPPRSSVPWASGRPSSRPGSSCRRSFSFSACAS